MDNKKMDELIEQLKTLEHGIKSSLMTIFIMLCALSLQFGLFMITLAVKL